MCAQTADFSVTSNFPVYDAWDGEICSRPAFIWFGFPSELSGFRLNYGKFERKTSGNWLPGIFGGLGVDPLNAANNRYQGLIRQNHGIREDNVLNLLLPIGFTVAQIDPAWLGTMNSFGRTRGETAHTSFTPTQLVDPGTEKNTVAQLVAGLEPIDLVFTRLKPR